MNNSQETAPFAEGESEGNESVAANEMTEDCIPLIVNGQRLSETAIAALREARMRKAQEASGDLPPEKGGARRETEPTRYGDWEKNGRAIDFS